MKKCLGVRSEPMSIDLVLLLVRLITGYAFILHGWGKIQTPFSWMPGDSVPGIFQGLAAFAEFGGGIALILGLLSRVASLGIFFTMIGAMAFHAVIMGHPFVDHTGGPTFEPATTYLMISLLLTVIGPGRFSLDSKIFGTSC